MAHNSDGAPEAENNRQSAQARSQNAAARGSADRRECCPAPLPTARRSCSSSRLAHSRLALVPEEAAAGFSFWRVYMPQRTRPWAVPRITCRHCRARTGPGGRISPGRSRSSVPPAITPAPLRGARVFVSSRRELPPATGQTAQPCADSSACSWFVQCLHRYSSPRRNIGYIVWTAGPHQSHVSFISAPVCALSHGLAVASSGDRPGRLGAGARRVTQGVPVCRSLRR